MTIRYGNNETTASAGMKVTLAAIIGIIVAVLIVSLGFARIAPLAGWDGAAVTYCIWIWSTIWPMNGETTERFALREDPSRTASDVVLLGASLFSLAAVGLVLFSSGQGNDAGKFLQAGLGVISVVVSWITVHAIFALRYAEQYYGKPAGGIDFGSTTKPNYKDFAYLSFTLGMTFQVSDTGFTSSTMRQIALRHTLLSYVFGTVILASTINLVAGLSQSS